MLKSDEKVLEKVKTILLDYGNFNFESNVDELLLYTNKIKDKTDVDCCLLSNIINNYYTYKKDRTDSKFYIVKDKIIDLYNYLITV